MTDPTDNPAASRERPTPPLDPVRRLIIERARASRLSLKALSLIAGYNESYIYQFITRGTPKHLPEGAREAIATALGVPPDMLRAPAVPPPLGAALPSAPMAGAPAAPLPTQRDIPVFRDDGEVDAAAASEWTWRPPALLTAGGAFAVWISRPRGRLRAGDLAYVRPTQPPRPGDTVILLADRRITAIGELAAGAVEDTFEVRESGAAPPRPVPQDGRLLKVSGVDFP